MLQRLRLVAGTVLAGALLPVLGVLDAENEWLFVLLVAGGFLAVLLIGSWWAVLIVPVAFAAIPLVGTLVTCPGSRCLGEGWDGPAWGFLVFFAMLVTFGALAGALVI